MSQSEELAATGPRLRWYQKLEFKVSTGFLIILLALVACLFAAVIFLLRPELRMHHEEIVGERSRAAVARVLSNLEQVESTAKALSAVALQDPRNLADVAPLLLNNAEALGVQRAAVYFAPYSVISSRRLLANRWALEKGEIRQLPDKQDNYLSDLKYNIAAESENGQCLWSGAYVNSANLPAVACSIAFRREGKLAGVIVLELRPASILRGLESSGQQYFAVVDANLKVLSAPSKLGATIGRPAAATTLAPFDLGLSRVQERPIRAATDQGIYEATQVSAVAATDKSFERAEVERLMLGVWNPWSAAQNSFAPEESIEINSDPWNAAATKADIFHIPGAYWWLISAHDVASASNWLDQSLFMTFGSAIAALVVLMALMFAILQRNVLLPIRALSQHIEILAKNPDSPADLDSSARNELGLLAHWFNERSTFAREAMDRASGAEKQIALEQQANQRSQQALAAEQKRTRQVMDASSDAVVFADEQGLVTYMNSASRALTGNDEADVSGKELSSVVRIFETANQTLLDDLPQRAHQEKWAGHLLRDIVLLDRLGEELPVVANVSQVPGNRDDSSGCALIIRRINQRASSKTQASDDAQRDKLTGLFDRKEFDRQFRELLADARSGAGQHAFLFVETDNFRELNDKHGNHVGDALLHQISEVLETTVGDQGALFRMRGTQFGVLLPDVDEEAAAKMAEEIRHTTASTQFSVGELILSETLSVGVLALDSSSKGPIEMYRLAENTCRSGQNGRADAVNRYRPGVVEGVNLAEEMAWVDRIKTGLNSDRFHLTSRMIQPLGDESEKTCHEIFVQFEDEDGFWVPVESFADTARRYSLAEAIDRWTVQAVIDTFAADDGQYNNVDFAIIRISGASLADRGFGDFVLEALKKSSLSGEKLCLQFGEDSMKARVRRLKTLCEKLESTGCKIAMGKFRGAKAASDLVRQLPINVLKVTGRMAADPEAFEIIEDIVSLGKELNRVVIADDLMEDTALANVKRAGILWAQGDIIARASPMLFSKGF